MLLYYYSIQSLKKTLSKSRKYMCWISTLEIEETYHKWSFHMVNIKESWQTFGVWRQERRDTNIPGDGVGGHVRREGWEGWSSNLELFFYWRGGKAALEHHSGENRNVGSTLFLEQLYSDLCVWLGDQGKRWELSRNWKNPSEPLH